MDAGTPRGGRTRVLAAVTLLVAAVVVPMLTSPALAIFSHSASVGSNTVSASSCLAAEVKTLQQGTASSTANGTTTVTISAVDTTKSFLLFTVRSNLNRPVGSMLRGKLVSSTSLQFIQSFFYQLRGGSL